MKRKDRGGKYRLHYVDVDGRRYQIDTGTADRALAELWLTKANEMMARAKLGMIPKVGKIDADIVAGKPQKSKPVEEEEQKTTLEEFRELYEKRCRDFLELAPKTIEANNNAFRIFIKILGNKNIQEVTDEGTGSVMFDF